MTINERFSEILKTKRISVKEAASIIGKSEVYIRKLSANEKRNILYNTVLRF